MLVLFEVNGCFGWRLVQICLSLMPLTNSSFFQTHALQSLVVTSLDFLWVFPQFNAIPGVNSFLNFCIYCVPTEKKKKKKKCATAETTCFYETPPIVEMMHSRMIQGTQEADQNISVHMQSCPGCHIQPLHSIICSWSFHPAHILWVYCIVCSVGFLFSVVVFVMCWLWKYNSYTGNN